jgi:hypothetical protein
MTSSLEVTDKASAAVAVAPRVQLQDIMDAIASVHYLNAFEAIEAVVDARGESTHLLSDSPLKFLTICLVTMKNGFTVIGKTAPASPENFNAELGRQFAYEDAIRQLWPLMGFSLRDRLAGQR